MLRAYSLGLVFGLAAHAAADADPAQRAQALRDGTRTSDSRWDAVLYLSAASTCTGTLVAPNVVLTAAHCLARQRAGKFSCDELGRLVSEADDAPPFEWLEASEVEIYAAPEDLESAEPLSTGRKIHAPALEWVGCANDIAFLELETPVDDIQPLRLELDEPPELGGHVEVLGHGKINVRSARPALNQATAAVEAVGLDSDVREDAQSFPGTLRLAVGLCDDDSGGPVLSLETGKVVGVLSLRAGDCLLAESFAYATLIPTHRELAATALRGADAPLPQVDRGAGCALRSASSGTPRALAALVCAGIVSAAIRRRGSYSGASADR